MESGAKERHTHTNVTEYAGLLGNACPAAVYEYQDAEGAEADSDGKKFVINSQNCIHVSLHTPRGRERAKGFSARLARSRCLRKISLGVVSGGTTNVVHG